jgi:WD40 repeat protein
VRTEGAPDSLALSPTGRRVAAYRGRTIELWDVETGRKVRSLEGHDLRVLVAKFDPAGRLLATAGEDGDVHVWRAEDGEEAAVLSGHAGTVKDLDFSRDGRLLATASSDGTARLWLAEAGMELLRMLGHRGPVARVAFSPDGGSLLTLSDDGTGRIWDASADRRPVTELKPTVMGGGNERYLLWAAFSLDGRRLMTAVSSRTQVWDATTGALSSQKRPGPEGGDRFLLEGYSDDWRRYVGHRLGDWKVYDAETDREIATLRGMSGAVRNVVFDPSGKTLVTLGRTARVWDVATGRELRAIAKDELGGANHVLDAAFSPDGRRLVIGTDEGASVWDAATWQKVTQLTLAAAKWECWAVAYSPDGSKVAASGDGVVAIWDAATWGKLADLPNNPGGEAVRDLAISSDSRLIAAANRNGAVPVWDLRTFESVYVLSETPKAASRVAFSPDGRLLMSVHGDGRVRLYAREMFLPFEDLRALTRSRVSRSALTDEERRLHLPADESPPPR